MKDTSIQTLEVRLGESFKVSAPTEVRWKDKLIFQEGAFLARPEIRIIPEDSTKYDKSFVLKALKKGVYNVVLQVIDDDYAIYFKLYKINVRD